VKIRIRAFSFEAEGLAEEVVAKLRRALDAAAQVEGQGDKLLVVDVKPLPRRVSCPRCGRDVSVVAGNVLRKHAPPGYARDQICHGSGMANVDR
jgi:hypothetical protein